MHIKPQIFCGGKEVEVCGLLSLVLNHSSMQSCFFWYLTLVLLSNLSCCSEFYVFLFWDKWGEVNIIYYLLEKIIEPCITIYRLFHKSLIVSSFFWQLFTLSFPGSAYVIRSESIFPKFINELEVPGLLNALLHSLPPTTTPYYLTNI